MEGSIRSLVQLHSEFAGKRAEIMLSDPIAAYSVTVSLDHQHPTIIALITIIIIIIIIILAAGKTLTLF